MYTVWPLNYAKCYKDKVLYSLRVLLGTVSPKFQSVSLGCRHAAHFEVYGIWGMYTKWPQYGPTTAPN